MSKNDELIERIIREVLANRQQKPQPTDNDHKSCSGCGHCVSERPAAVSRIADAGAQRITATVRVGKNIDAAVAAMIDHTLLKPNATSREIEQLCAEAMEYGFYSVCINPTHVERCRVLLEGSRVRVCTVIGFPLGANTTDTKSFEAKNAESLGATEIDMVINIGALKDNQLDFVKNDIAAVVNATSRGVITKVILENAYLTTEEKIKGCLMAKAAGADFVKTSTGFGPTGATLEDVALMRHVVGEQIGVKAAGGIRDTEMAAKMLKAGATRIGASASVKIVTRTK
jgi:deoxyribose-phosphate aldolase